MAATMQFTITEAVSAYFWISVAMYLHASTLTELVVLLLIGWTLMSAILWLPLW